MEQDDVTVKFVVGLGNPGREYEGTRHNVGFMVLKELHKRWDFGTNRSKFHARCRHGRIGGRKVVLVAPQSYMNRSGRSVVEITSFYKADPESVLVVVDDMALRLGRLRARASGSAGGHKGLADVLKMMGTDRLARLRIGIGSGPGQGEDPTGHVLGRFGSHEMPALSEAVKLAACAAEDWIKNGITYVMNHYNHGENLPAGGHGRTSEPKRDGKDQ